MDGLKQSQTSNEALPERDIEESHQNTQENARQRKFPSQKILIAVLIMLCLAIIGLSVPIVKILTKNQTCGSAQILNDDGTCKDCETYSRPDETQKVCISDSCDSTQIQKNDGTCQECSYSRPDETQKVCISDTCDDATQYQKIDGTCHTCESNSYLFGSQCVTPSNDELVAYHEADDTYWTWDDPYGNGYPICSLISSQQTDSGKYICQTTSCPDPDNQYLRTSYGKLYCYDYYGEEYSQSTITKCGSYYPYLMIWELQGGAFASYCSSPNPNDSIDANDWFYQYSSYPAAYMTETYSTSATSLDIDCSANGCWIEKSITI